MPLIKQNEEVFLPSTHHYKIIKTGTPYTIYCCCCCVFIVLWICEMNSNLMWVVKNFTSLSFELKIRTEKWKFSSVLTSWHPFMLSHVQSQWQVCDIQSIPTSPQWMIMMTGLFRVFINCSHTSWAVVICFNLSSPFFSIISLQTAVILTQSVTAAWTVLMTLPSALPLTLTSLKWTPVMMDLVQVGNYSTVSFMSSLFLSHPPLCVSFSLSLTNDNILRWGR